MFKTQQIANGGLALIAKLRAFRSDESGASIIIIALTLPALVGAIGLAAEVSYWRLDYRAMQNAADAAAIAAATNNSSGYAAEAQAVAAQYGFQNGSGQITVAVTNPNTAAGCTANCYVVTISDNVPLFFSQVVGFQGNTTVDDQKASTITATSVAMTTPSDTACILALAGSGAQGISSDGAPNTNLNGCNTMSNTSAVCNGHNMNAGVSYAVGTPNSGCGNSQKYQPAMGDARAALASNLPADPCGGSYPQETKKSDLPSSNQWIGSLPTYHAVFNNGVNYAVVCGDQQLTANTTLPANTILVIENGQLDTNGYTLSGDQVTVIFSGSNTANYQHIPTGDGTLDISSSSSGTWSGIAIYQDPNLTKNVDISAAGNSPTWDISGLVYLPHSSVTLSGAVNKSSTGYRCFEMVVDNITINGTGDILPNDNQCTTQGLNQDKVGSRGMLVN